MADDDEADDVVDGGPQKSERKRQRERQRRSDLANAFDELASLLAQIDPEETDSSTANRKKRRKSVGEPTDADVVVDSNGMTRLDLIGRTVEVLVKLQRENSQLKERLNDQNQRYDPNDNKEVLVMVPTLSPADTETGTVVNRHSSFPPHQHFIPTSHGPVDYSQHHHSYDYYGRHTTPQHPSYQSYPAYHPQNWSSHTSSRSSPVQTDPMMSHQVPPPPHPPHPGQYSSNDCSLLPPQSSHHPQAYGNHSNVPQRTRSHTYDYNVVGKNDNRRES